MIIEDKMNFNSGQEVEILNLEPGLEDSWAPATVIPMPRNVKNKDTMFYVEYKHFQSGKNPLREQIDVFRVRPLPPREPTSRIFRIGEEVDVLYHDVWWEGVLTKIHSGGLKYSVFFKRTEEELEYNQSDLRTHLDWVEGKWIKSQNQEITFSEQSKKTGEKDRFICSNIPTLQTSSLLRDGLSRNPTSFGHCMVEHCEERDQSPTSKEGVVPNIKQTLLRDDLLKNASSSCSRVGNVDNKLTLNDQHSPFGVVVSKGEFALKNVWDRLVEKIPGLTEASCARQIKATKACQRANNQSNSIAKKSPSDVLALIHPHTTLRSDLAKKLAVMMEAYQKEGISPAGGIHGVFPFPAIQHKNKVDHFEVIRHPKPQVQPQKRQDIMLSIGGVEEVLGSSEIEHQGIGDTETQRERAKRRKGSSADSGLEEEFHGKEMTDIQMDHVPLPHQISDEHQTIPGNVIGSSSPTLKKLKKKQGSNSAKDGDYSQAPVPVCSCTGVSRQCIRNGDNRWLSTCCTTSISEYPLPMDPSRPGKRVFGRSMRNGPYVKLLERLAGEGYNFSDPVDLKDHWFSLGANMFVTEGTTIDFSQVPVPVCSCTGVSRQCHRKGDNSWRSTCCTTSISEYPLPMNPSRHGRRMVGRGMRNGPYVKLLQRLAAEGYDFSNAVDMKDRWAVKGDHHPVCYKKKPIIQ